MARNTIVKIDIKKLFPEAQVLDDRTFDMWGKRFFVSGTANRNGHKVNLSWLRPAGWNYLISFWNESRNFENPQKIRYHLISASDIVGEKEYNAKKVYPQAYTPQSQLYRIAIPFNNYAEFNLTYLREDFTGHEKGAR